MRAAVLHGIGDMRVEDVDDPEVEGGDVLIGVRAASVCGTDVHFYGGQLESEPPMILGHDFSGVVERVGDRVDEFSPGESVIAEIARYDGTCHFCKTGRYHLCVNSNYLGFGADGAFAEYVSAPAKNVFMIPKGVTLDEAAIMEPVTVALHTAELLELEKGESVAVFGAGPIGLAVAQVANLRGARVIVVEPKPQRRDLAVTLGFSTVMDPSKGDLKTAMEKLTEGLGPECAVEAVGSQETVDLAGEVIRSGGRVALIGAEQGLHGPPIRYDDVTIRTVMDGGSGNYPKALALIAEGKVDVKSMITHRIGLDELPEMMEKLSRGSLDAVKVIVRP